MRVLVVPKWYPWPDRPVFGSFCREQALALAAGHDVIVLASEPVRAPSFRAFQLSDAVESEGLRTLRLRYRRPRFRPAAMAFQLAGMVVALLRLRRSGWRPEIVHCHVYSAGLPALILGALSSAPVVVTEHYTGFQRGLVTGYDRRIARIVFGWADLVAPVSEDLAREVRAIAPRARIEVVGNVVDTGVFHPAPAQRSPESDYPGPPLHRPEVQRDQAGSGRVPRLLTVAALTEKKGHRYLLEAMSALRREGPVTLELVGGGELRGELQRRVQDLGLEGAVGFRGEQPKPVVAELMREADLFVLPSLFENQPCVLIEAMASGLPSVATAVGGVPELLGEHGGRLCRSADSDALAAAVRAALADLRATDRQGLARDALERFGYETFVRRWTAIYTGLLNGSSIAQPSSPAHSPAAPTR
jgi:glycosyltransferase involved in cell wall biosynthesis